MSDKTTLIIIHSVLFLFQIGIGAYAILKNPQIAAMSAIVGVVQARVPWPWPPQDARIELPK